MAVIENTALESGLSPPIIHGENYAYFLGPDATILPQVRCTLISAFCLRARRDQVKSEKKTRNTGEKTVKLFLEN